MQRYSMKLQVLRLTMTPKKNDLTPQKAMKWFDEIRKISIKRGRDTATKYEIQYMFKYADKLMQYQVAMETVNIDEDGHYFECARCGQAIDWSEE